MRPQRAGSPALREEAPEGRGALGGAGVRLRQEVLGGDGSVALREAERRHARSLELPHDVVHLRATLAEYDGARAPPGSAVPCEVLAERVAKLREPRLRPVGEAVRRAARLEPGPLLGREEGRVARPVLARALDALEAAREPRRALLRELAPGAEQVAHEEKGAADELDAERVPLAQRPGRAPLLARRGVALHEGLQVRLAQAQERGPALRHARPCERHAGPEQHAVQLVRNVVGAVPEGEAEDFLVPRVDVRRHLRIVLVARVDSADAQVPDDLLHVLGGASRRRAQREHPEGGGALPELGHDRGVGVAPCRAVRLVDHAAGDGPAVEQAAVQVVVHRLGRGEHDLPSLPELRAPARRHAALQLGHPFRQPRHGPPARFHLLRHERPRGRHEEDDGVRKPPGKVAHDDGRDQRLAEARRQADERVVKERALDRLALVDAEGRLRGALPRAQRGRRKPFDLAVAVAVAAGAANLGGPAREARTRPPHGAAPLALRASAAPAACAVIPRLLRRRQGRQPAGPVRTAAARRRGDGAGGADGEREGEGGGRGERKRRAARLSTFLSLHPSHLVSRRGRGRASTTLLPNSSAALRVRRLGAQSEHRTRRPASGCAAPDLPAPAFTGSSASWAPRWASRPAEDRARPPGPGTRCTPRFVGESEGRVPGKLVAFARWRQEACAAPVPPACPPPPETPRGESSVAR